MSKLSKTYTDIQEWRAAVKAEYPGVKIWANTSSSNKQVNAEVGSKLVGNFRNGIGVLHMKDKEQQWTGIYSATTRLNKRISFTATVSAPDRYVAGDKLKAMASRTYGSDLYNIVIQFGPQRIAPSSVSNKVVAMAGEAEDSRRTAMAKDHHVYIHLPRRQGKTRDASLTALRAEAISLKSQWQAMSKEIDRIVVGGGKVLAGDPLSINYARIKGKYDSIMRRIGPSRDVQSRKSNGEFGTGGGSSKGANEGTPHKGDDPKTAAQRRAVAKQAKELSNTPQAKAHLAKQQAVAAKLKNGGSLNAREEHNLSRMRQGTSLAGKTSKQHPPSKGEIEGLYSGRE